MVALFETDNIERPKQKSNEWYTPYRYIEAAREVMGSIDLDPASCEMANQTVKATRYYTEEQNGLDQLWYGNIWLNPPFGRVSDSGASKIRMFTAKLVNEYISGHVAQAILLSTVQTNASWFSLLWDYLICFSDHRLHFSKLINGKLEVESRDSHMLGTIFVYLGPNESRFIEVFSQFGRIAKAIDAPKPKPITHTLWEVAGDV